MGSNTEFCKLMSSTNMEPIKDSYGLTYYRPTHDKTIEGQYKQEEAIWNKQIIPVKLYKYLRTKLK